MTAKRSDRDSRQKILDAALDVFYEAGFDGARVDAIAKRAGVNQALIYYYFKNKEGLFKDLLSLHIDEMIAAKKDAIGEKGIHNLERYRPDVVRNIVDQMMGVLKQKEKVFSIVLGEFFRNPGRKSGVRVSGLFLPAVEESREWMRTMGFDPEDIDRAVVAGIFFGSAPMIAYATLGEKVADSYGIDKKSLDAVFSELIGRFSEDYVAFLKSGGKAGLSRSS